jgi:hypothetical protein
VRVFLTLLLWLLIALLLALRSVPLGPDAPALPAMDRLDCQYQQQAAAHLERIAQAHRAGDAAQAARLWQDYRPILSAWQDHVRRSARRVVP